MPALSSPSFTLRPQRDGRRHKQPYAMRPRAISHAPGSISAASGVESDCVFKRLPAIGDTPAPRVHG